MSFRGGNDETFAVLMFGLVASLNVCIFAPMAVRFCWRLRLPEYRQWVRLWCAHHAAIASYCCRKPRAVLLGLRTLWRNPSFTRTFVAPQVRQTFFGWRLIFVALFFFLLSIVAYQQITFDPYDVLGVPPDAEPVAVKKAYRQLSLKWHPDKNQADEARERYRAIRRAYKAVTDPEGWEAEMAEEAAQGSSAMGVALPSFLTDPDYARYSMTLLLLLLVAVPAWLLYRLFNKDVDSCWVVIKRICRQHDMAEPFYEMLGQPASFEKGFCRRSRPRLVAFAASLDKKVGGRMTRDPDRVIGAEYLTTVEILQHFYPEGVRCTVDLRNLIAAAAGAQQEGQQAGAGPRGASVRGPSKAQRKGKGDPQQERAERILSERLFVDKDLIRDLAELMQGEPQPSEQEELNAALYHSVVEARVKDQKLTDPQLLSTPYRIPTEDECDVANYFLRQIIGAICQDAWLLNWEQDRRNIVDRLITAHQDKVEALESVRKQAASDAAAAAAAGRPAGGEGSSPQRSASPGAAGDAPQGSAMSALMRKLLVKVINKDTACERAIFDMIGEVKALQRRMAKQQEQAWRERDLQYRKAQRSRRLQRELAAEQAAQQQQTFVADEWD
eukprot:TRINITY_DN47209_c0_g1_i1.p2 TRINITY_DN47209_c0_g1~~TRINITY_DN47209_c0_g1_i1.p2  ORF type:complete len:612 (+),score=256.74 TRINITY_DN47209_c0_g1_i1:95-1930(+)